MHNITINVKQNSYKHLINILSNIKDVSVIKDDIINDTLSDIHLFEEAKKDKKDVKSIDEMLKKYNIEN